MSVVAAVVGELEGYGEPLSTSALAATALALAAELDEPENSATSKSMCAKALMDALEQLRALAPPTQEKGRLYDIRAGVAAKRAGGPAA